MADPRAPTESAPSAEDETIDSSPSHASDIRRTDRSASDPGVAQAGGSVPLEPGVVLQGTYEVKRLLGRGAMGGVYLVEHLVLGKQFAAKVVEGAHAVNASAVARLRNEARITSAIEHESIVNVTHFGQTEDGRVFIVMELLRGEDLRARMARQIATAEPDGSPRWLPDEEVRRIVDPVLSALGAAHAAGVIHRDLKPDNIFLSESKSGRRTPKIVDFGIGKLRSDAHQDLRLTDTGSIVGTPLYMAPEQSRSSREVDPRADLYSCGVMIFEMMCGRAPFEAGHVFEMVVKHATEAPPDPRSYRPDMPEAVAAFILRALAKSPDERFESAAAMLDAWTDAWRGVAPAPVAQPSALGESSSSGKMAVAALSSSDARISEPVRTRESLGLEESARREPEARGRERVRTGSWLWIASAAGVLSIGVAGAWWAATRDSSTTSPTSDRDAPPSLPAGTTRPEQVALERPDSPPRDPNVNPTVPPATVAPVLHTHRVTSEPAGAMVLRDGVEIGATPRDIERRGDERVEIVLRLAGRRDVHQSIGPSSPAVVNVRLPRPMPASTRRNDYPGLAPR